MPPVAPHRGRAGSLPAGHLAQLLAAGTQDPIDSWSCFVRHHVGGVKRKGGACWGARGLSRLLMTWELPDVRLRHPEGPPACGPLSSVGPRTAPSSRFPPYSVCSGGRPADGKNQPGGRERNKGRDSAWAEELPSLPSVNPLSKRLSAHALPTCPHSPGQSLGFVGASSEKEG